MISNRNVYGVVHGEYPVICCSSFNLLYKFLITHRGKYKLLKFPDAPEFKVMLSLSWSITLDTTDNQEFTIYNYPFQY